ncbi:RNA polymerase sigma-70 factor [Paenibacillus sp. GCM10012303]|uniref:RNA polymerase sigma-70 factor n=1 Tax=Paenibacillus sp. GCM10012303 TaxID=3317340 RepID=UPI003621A26F
MVIHERELAILRIETEQWYTSYKPLLFSLAYRMLGSAADAEDIVQDTFLAVARLDVSQVTNIKSYLCKMATNRCLDRIKSAAAKRETYVGPWLPEPIDTSARPEDPYDMYMLKESISTAYLLMLEQLSATERAVFLLREVYRYEYEEIADIVGKSSANCRQIFRRAKNKIGENPEIETKSDPSHRQEMVASFVEAMSTGNVARMLELLAPEAVLLSDGGGKVRAAVNPILGPDRIWRFFEGLRQKYAVEFRGEWRMVNGAPGFVQHRQHDVWIVTFHIREGRIESIYIVANPDKTARFIGNAIKQ